ncbi:MAG: hypothetical protein GC187_11935 [Alphaproteobacteria bacterium]|nr:hypothetical protein [Alphaproteobacteria bacterium]
MISAPCDPDILDLIGELPPSDVETISEAALADLLGITSRHVRNLAADGVARKAGPGRYELRASVRAYAESLRAKASRGRAKADDPELRAERLRLAAAQAEKVELSNARTRGELLSARDVESAWAGVLREVRAAMLAIPGRVNQSLPHLTSHDLATLDREIRNVLAQAAGAHE